MKFALQIPSLMLLSLLAACNGSAPTQVGVDVGGNLADRSRGDDTLRRGLRDRAELEAFLDGLITATLEDKHVAGATIAVVKDGAIFFAKGYGYANVERRKPVDPERTLFRIGSVSKLFTWTAVMQLVEAGRLDLDADVNRYLDFEVPGTYPEPITLRHTMTHTAGFEDDGRDLWARDHTKIVPVGRWLASRMPARVRPPGTYAAYSNYATALAGYIVERVSGMSWEDYIEQHILAPLGMTRTTGRQPLPARFREDMSQGYRSSRGAFERREWEILMGASPAGAISASATDIATFMLAHLGDGAVGDRRIMSEATVARMHARAFGHDPRIPGLALGFYEKSSHGLRIIGHSGDTQWFHTDLALIPSENVGVFVSYNTDTGGSRSLAPLPFLRTFLDHYYPTQPPPFGARANASAQAKRVAGEYRFNRMSYTTFQKAFGLIGAVTIGANTDGSLRMLSPLGDMRLLPVGPLLYRKEAGTELVAFEADGPGRALHGFVGSLPMLALERVPWSQSARLHWIILGGAVVIFAAIARAALDRLIRRRDGPPAKSDLPGRSFIVSLALAHLSFVVTFVLMMADPIATMTQSPTALRIALALPVVGAALTVLAAAAAVRHWTNGWGTRTARIRYDAVVVVALLFIWSLSQWNLLWWKL